MLNAVAENIRLIVILSWVYFSFVVWYVGVNATTQLVEALRYKLGVAGSIPDGVVRIFHSLLPAEL